MILSRKRVEKMSRDCQVCALGYATIESAGSDISDDIVSLDDLCVNF